MELLPLNEYDKIIISYSGGKDSLACLLRLIELGATRSQLELWHQHVDGEPGSPHLMDWPCTKAYVEATSRAMNIPLRCQWKDGGFAGEMLRENSLTKGIYYEDGQGRVQYLPPSDRGKRATRRLFPQVSADLSVRWCSAYLKIDVACRAINNDLRFNRANILFVTGERREESTARSKYQEVACHRSNSKRRRVDQWRAIIDWREQEVWEIIRKHRIRAHPAYYLGFGRVSCMTCIFGDKHQWASTKSLAPERVYQIAGYEKEFGKTIKKGESVLEQAEKGESFVEDSPAELRQLAMSDHYPTRRFFLSEDEEWTMPGGAFKRCGAPS